MPIIKQSENNKDVPAMGVFFIDNKGMIMHYQTWGNGTKTALLIHGLCASSYTWEKIAQQLAKENYTIIAPDLTGHGKSPKEATYSVQGWSEQILALTENKTIDLIIGHSIGGLVAANLSQTLRPKKLILLDPVFRFPKYTIGAISQLIFGINGKRQYFQHKYFPKRKTGSPLRPESPSRWDDLRQWDIKTIQALKQHTPIVRGVGRNNIHTLIIRAKNSYILPSNIFKHWAHKPHLNIKYIDGDHNIHWDRAEQTWGEIKDHLLHTATIPAVKP